MQRLVLAAILAVAASGISVDAFGQSLERRVARAGDGSVSFRFAARPGVCGDGRSFIGEGWDAGRGLNIYTSRAMSITAEISRGDLRARCTPGPVHVILDVRRGDVRDVVVYAGGGPDAGPGADTELGTVAPQEAALFLLASAEELGERALGRAMFAATLADSTEIAGTLARMARAADLRPMVRERALRYLPRATEREDNEEAMDVARSIAADSRDVTSVRERAIRVLGQTDDGDEVLRGLYAELGHRRLRERAIRVAGAFGGDANAEWLKALALDAGEPLSLRERAIRVLGGDLYFVAELRDLYPRLAEPSLKERIIRVAASEGGDEGERWLRAIVGDPSERRALRERAIRVLGELGRLDYLLNVYPTLADRSLKARVVRLAGAHGGSAEVRWLRQVAADPEESMSVRDRALRVLHDRGVASRDLATLYDELASSSLRDRLLRLLGDRGDDDAIDKLIEVARDGRSPSLRRRAFRLLADSGHPRAADFLERTVRRDP